MVEVQRYFATATDDGHVDMVPDQDGSWVDVDDFLAQQRRTESAESRADLQEAQAADVRVKLTLAEADRAGCIEDLAECYRLSGADPEGDDEVMLARVAVEEVRRLREEYDDDEEIKLREAAESRCEELEEALRGLAVRCESEAIEAAGDVANAADIGDFPEANFQSGRRTAYNTVEAWIDNVLSDLRGHEQEEREK